MSFDLAPTMDAIREVHKDGLREGEDVLLLQLGNQGGCVAYVKRSDLDLTPDEFIAKFIRPAVQAMLDGVA